MLLRSAGVRPHVYVYGAPSDIDARIATAIGEAEGFPVEVFHKAAFAQITPDAFPAIVERNFFETDALVTDVADLALMVLVADCTPVLLADAEAGVVGAAHAGRPGMVAGVVPATVEAMRELGARRIHAVVGPSVCGRCYEVPAQMRDVAAERSPASRAVTWAGAPAIDVAAGVVEQLADLDVPVRWVPGCTREDDDLFSYRRDGRTGRTAGVIVRRSA